MNRDSKIYIAGHRGMVGSAVWRALEVAGYTNLIGKTSKELDLRNQVDVNNFIAEQKPIIIIDAAARVGGILANNNFQYKFLMENLQIQNNLIQAAHENNVQKFIFGAEHKAILNQFRDYKGEQLSADDLGGLTNIEPVKVHAILTDLVEHDFLVQTNTDKPRGDWLYKPSENGRKYIQELT